MNRLLKRTCKKCKGYGQIEYPINNCDCKNICRNCENKDKTIFDDCNKCWGSGLQKIKERDIVIFMTIVVVILNILY